MAIRALDVEELLCPACGLRPQGPNPASGFCEECEDDRASARYAERELPAIEARRDAWRRRTYVRPVSNRERQRRHRLLEHTRPRELAPVWADPLLLAEEALHLIAAARTVARRYLGPGQGSTATAEGTGGVVDCLDATAELVRQLAWGPDGEPPRGIPAESDRPPQHGLLAALARG